MATPFLFGLAAFATGLLFGSFLNVVISRVPRGESIVSPRSHCPHCAAPIRGYDNIPLLSWILLRTRCRSCKQSIPWRYPLVEFAGGIWFGLVASHIYVTSPAGLYAQISAEQWISLALAGISLLILGLVLMALMVIDWEHQVLPDALTFTGIFLSFLLTCTQAIVIDPMSTEIHLHGRNPLTSPGATVDRGNLLFTGPEALLGRWLLSILAAAAILLIIRWLYRALRHREGMGLGDIKLLALIAAFLGFWPAILSLFLGILFATVYALVLLARRRADALTRLPFGSFLGAGGLLAALVGPQILAWYKTLL